MDHGTIQHGKEPKIDPGADTLRAKIVDGRLIVPTGWRDDDDRERDAAPDDGLEGEG